MAGLLSCAWQHVRRVAARRRFMERRGTKQFQDATLADGGEVVPVRGEIQRPDFLGDARMATCERSEDRGFAAKRNVPKSDGVVAAATGQCPAIGRKRQSPNRSLVPV